MINLLMREIATLKGMAQGKTNPEIAQEMSISRRSVDYYRTSLLTKLQANNRAHAVAIAYEWGILKPGVK